MSKITFPCLEIKMVPYALVEANNYNPNHVPKDKMELLRQSIIDNGFCFPIVTIWDDDRGRYVIIDGFHRYTVLGPKWLDEPEIPVVVLPHDISKRMAATMQFNKARGTHQVDLDAELIRALLEQGMDEEEISLHLGIDSDTVHRYKQLTGILSLFANTNYSLSWGMEDEK
ncbi:MAG: ParB/RepB/Spo0J family partition protein [Desulfobulbales bacterium]|nr:ParB/RepB/Spo0J family partition protein [Desulfobulbales bacterium]